MRFSVPRSCSPSPVRRRPRRSSTFAAPSDSDDYTSTSSSSSTSSSESDSDSDDSFCYASESEVPPPKAPRRYVRTRAEQRHFDETIAAIRLRTRHSDPYEAWERQARKDAFHTARKIQHVLQMQFYDKQDKLRLQEKKRLADQHARQVAEVQAQLAALEVKRKEGDAKLQEVWKDRHKKFWDRIESAIKTEEENIKRKIEAERRAREEEERRRQEEEKRKQEEERKRKEDEERKRVEEELRRRLQEEKRQQEEEAKRQAKEEEERKKSEEEETKKRTEEEARIKKERFQTEEQSRVSLGLTTADEDWTHSRQTLLQLKAGPMKTIKSQKHLKSIWSAMRRQITPKIGQLTNNPGDIARISQQLHDILLPPIGPPHIPEIYHALLSSLAKAILLQAEIEVTAEKRSAGPLGQVTANLLGTLMGFPEVFFTKLVQRAGGWPVPVVVPPTDVNGQPWKREDGGRTKAQGYRKSSRNDAMESAEEYISRMTGMMRVYFHILKAPVSQPLDRRFETPRYWIWFARIMGERELLETAAAAQIIYAALDVFGLEAKNIWGRQWVKVLGLLYEGVTVGLEGGLVIGGQSAEGKAARARVQLEVERIMGTR